jgi:hypothetical protein
MEYSLVWLPDLNTMVVEIIQGYKWCEEPVIGTW